MLYSSLSLDTHLSESIALKNIEYVGRAPQLIKFVVVECRAVILVRHPLAVTSICKGRVSYRVGYLCFNPVWAKILLKFRWKKWLRNALSFLTVMLE